MAARRQRHGWPFLQQTGDPVAAQQLALQVLAILRQQQASALACFDVFWVLAAVTVRAIRLVVRARCPEFGGLIVVFYLMVAKP